MAGSEQKVIDDVRKVCNQAVELGKHLDLTVRQVIQTLIDDMDHDEAFLKSKPIKKIIKETAAQALQTEEPESNNASCEKKSTSKEDAKDTEEMPVKKRLSHPKDSPSRPPSNTMAKPSSDERDESKEKTDSKKRSLSPSNQTADPPRPPSKKKGRPSSKGGFKSSEMIDSDGNSVHEEESSKPSKPSSNPKPKKERKIKETDESKATSKTDKKSADGDDAEDQSESEQRKTSPRSNKKTLKGKRESLPLDKEEERIKKLKSLVVACGVRKQWKKEFQDRPTSKQQIQHLTKILEGLGMTGRLSMNKAKEIKARRDLEAEVNELVASNRVDSNDDDSDQASLNGEETKNESKKRKKNRTVNDSSGDESSDHPQKPQSKRNPFAFLGDQGSDDSS